MMIYNRTKREIGHPFLTCPESREGLRMLSNDIYKFANKPSSESDTKFFFVSMIKIAIVCALITFGLSVGCYCFKLIIEGL